MGESLDVEHSPALQAEIRMDGKVVGKADTMYALGWLIVDLIAGRLTIHRMLPNGEAGVWRPALNPPSAYTGPCPVGWDQSPERISLDYDEIEAS